jgi:hypothetical protein
MKKLAACLAVLAVAAPFATPAVASASPSESYVASVVKRQFATHLRQRFAGSGIAVVRTTMDCSWVGGSRYSCYGTYTAAAYGGWATGTRPATAGVPIAVNWPNWHTVGMPTVLRVG